MMENKYAYLILFVHNQKLLQIQVIAIIHVNIHASLVNISMWKKIIQELHVFIHALYGKLTQLYHLVLRNVLIPALQVNPGLSIAMVHIHVIHHAQGFKKLQNLTVELSDVQITIALILLKFLKQIHITLILVITVLQIVIHNLIIHLMTMVLMSAWIRVMMNKVFMIMARHSQCALIH